MLGGEKGYSLFASGSADWTFRLDLVHVLADHCGVDSRPPLVNALRDGRNNVGPER